MLDNNHTFNILIADDIIQNIQILKSVLEGENYNVISVSNGRDALDLALKNNYDLILLDINMPKIDGFETCRRLKLNQKTKDIPVIFLTVETDIDSVVTGFELGAVDYVRKPFNAIELIARVKTHLTLKLTNENLAKEIEERKKTEQYLRASKTHLKELNATKDKIFSIIINDINTPITKLLNDTQF